MNDEREYDLTSKKNGFYVESGREFKDPGFDRPAWNIQNDKDVLHFAGDPGFSRISDTFQARSFESLSLFFNDTCNKNMSDKIKNISSYADALSSICASEDSSIASSYSAISDTTNAISEKMRELFKDLSNELTVYMNETLSNETLTSQELTDINDSMAAANSAIQSISWK